jgi:anti-anti-sigma factor
LSPARAVIQCPRAPLIRQQTASCKGPEGNIGNMGWTSRHILGRAGGVKRPLRRHAPFAGSTGASRQRMITHGTTVMMLTRVADAPVGEQLELSQRVLPTGEAVAGMGGELDFATAEMAVRYVNRVIDSHHGPVIVDLTALSFCDAQGLSALVRMAGYAERAGRPFRLVSPTPSVVKIMRITGLDRRFLVPPASRPPDS